MQRLCKILFSALFCIALCFSFACSKDTVKLDGDYLVIVADGVAENTTLLAYMEQLQKEGEFTFEKENGMVTSVNGKKNDTDYNPCWMLYTSDTENSNGAWGSVEYGGKVYNSASLGMESLLVKNGETYIWWYQTF